MTIKQGDLIPSVGIKRLGADGIEDIDTAAILKGKRVVLFGIPGAFTPSCQEKHLPGYLKNADKIKNEGVDEIICVAVNDPFVLKAFARELGSEGKITFWSDGNAVFAKATGLELDAAGAGLGLRNKRFSMLIEDGRIESMDVEEKASEVDLSSAETCLLRLAA